MTDIEKFQKWKLWLRNKELEKENEQLKEEIESLASINIKAQGIIAELKEQIEKIKNCENCEYLNGHCNATT